MKAIAAVFLFISLALNVLLGYKLWFGEGNVRTSHSSGGLVVMRTPGGLLEVSTIAAEERFESTTSHTVLGIDVGKTVALLRVPTVYRYHIPLAKDWSFRVMGDALIVVAPAVKPSLPVAIDTGNLESFSSGLWSPFTGADAREALQKSITRTLGEKAGSPERLLLQREAARKTVSEFVQKWVVEQPRWKGAKTPAVLVFFEDEALGDRAAKLLLD